MPGIFHEGLNCPQCGLGASTTIKKSDGMYWHVCVHGHFWLNKAEIKPPGDGLTDEHLDKYEQDLGQLDCQVPCLATVERILKAFPVLLCEVRRLRRTIADREANEPM